MANYIELDTLYAYTAESKIKVWRIGAIENADGTATILAKSGLKGGSLVKHETHVKVGKNLGKANATTPYEQACKEAKAKHQKKLDKGYVTAIGQWTQLPLPMRLHQFWPTAGQKGHGHKLIYPVLGQAKLNGVHCLTKNHQTNPVFLSKTLKDYNKVLSKTPQGAQLKKPFSGTSEPPDGEI